MLDPGRAHTGEARVRSLFSRRLVAAALPVVRLIVLIYPFVTRHGQDFLLCEQAGFCVTLGR